MRWLALALVAACGRVDFAPAGASAGRPANLGDGGPSGDGPAGDGAMAATDSGGATDGLAASPCASATVATVGTPAAETTCVADLIDGCGPPSTEERIYKFTAPATGSYQFEALDAGDNNINNSIGVLDASCVPTPNCSGIYGTSLTAGDIVYFAVEASAGGCTSIRLEIIGS